MKSKQLQKICEKYFTKCIAAHPKEKGRCLQTDIADPCNKVISEFLEVKRYGHLNK